MAYQGKILRIDLTEKKVEEEELNLDYAKKFLGGSALGARYFLDEADSDVDPLSPENPMIFMTGPLTATGAPNSSRHFVCSYSPLTGIWGEGSSGGAFGMKLKMTGYDGIIIEGKSEDMVYITIENDEVEIKDGSDLEGLDTYETQEEIEEEMGPAASVSSIGQAGENLVDYACIMNDEGRVTGRVGLGAVMGSKNLKAIGVIGTQAVELDDEEEFRKVVKKVAEETNPDGLDPLLSSGIIQNTSKNLVSLLPGLPDSMMDKVPGEMVSDVSEKGMEYFGTAGWVGVGEAHGDLPVKYFTESEFDGASEIDGFAMRDRILKDNYNCPACDIGCGRVIEIDNEKYEVEHDDGPEYETIGSYGSLLLIDDIEAIAYLNSKCNEYGLDTVSSGVSIGFAIHLFEKGVIDEDDVGFSLEWGNPDKVEKLIDMIVKKEGFGEILAKGVREMGKEFDAEDEAAHVKGLEIPMHDPRAFHSMAVTYATSPRGACHNRGDSFMAQFKGGNEEIGVEAVGRFEKEGAGEVAARWQDYRELYNTLVICEFAEPGMDAIRDMVNYGTGMSYSKERLLKIGERSRNLKRMINKERGITADDDELQDINLRPVGGGTQDNVPDLDYMLSEYYEYRDWDEETGMPTEEKLEDLDLDSLFSKD